MVHRRAAERFIQLSRRAPCRARRQDGVDHLRGSRASTRRLSYRELHAEVCRFANALKAQGVGHGDRVVIYMPLVPEVVVAMHACDRIGAIHSVVFGGFSALALKDRIEDTGAKLVITADGGWRAGHVIELKAATDKALASGCPTVERVIVYRRTDKPVAMDAATRRVVARRRRWDSRRSVSPSGSRRNIRCSFCIHPARPASRKAFSTPAGGYLLGAKLTMQWVFDLRADDVFWCTADVGWVTGHSYVAYGPLAAGATVVYVRRWPRCPDGGRFWKICQDHGVTIFYTAPTAIRALMKLGDELPARYDLSRLRLLGSVGEPINPEAWMWYQKRDRRRALPDRRYLVADRDRRDSDLALAGCDGDEAGIVHQPLPGIDVDIVDDHGKPVNGANAGGYLVIKKPWPSMLRTIWRDNERYTRRLLGEVQNSAYYVAGDSAHRDKDGYYWIMGRIDDVLNVAGHRLGTMEVESALVAHPRVAEAAVVGKPHEIKGESVFAFVVLPRRAPDRRHAAHS